jgi:hypothetical protein
MIKANQSFTAPATNFPWKVARDRRDVVRKFRFKIVLVSVIMLLGKVRMTTHAKLGFTEIANEHFSLLEHAVAFWASKLTLNIPQGLNGLIAAPCVLTARFWLCWRFGFLCHGANCKSTLMS